MPALLRPDLPSMSKQTDAQQVDAAPIYTKIETLWPGGKQDGPHGLLFSIIIRRPGEEAKHAFSIGGVVTVSYRHLTMPKILRV